MLWSLAVLRVKHCWTNSVLSVTVAAYTSYIDVPVHKLYIWYGSYLLLKFIIIVENIICGKVVNEYLFIAGIVT